MAAGRRKFDELPRDPFILGHRGSGVSTPPTAARYKENTIDSFQYALTLGARWMELDAMMNADGHLVVNHNVSWHGLMVHDMTDEECIKAGFAFMDKVHEALPLDIGLDFEVKLDLADALSDKYVDACLEWVRDKSRQRPVVLSSFDPMVVARAAQDGMPAGWITHAEAILHESVTSVARLGASVAVVHESTILRGYMELPGMREVKAILRDVGVRLWAWDVDPQNVARLLDAGVTGLCTDDIVGVQMAVSYY